MEGTDVPLLMYLNTFTSANGNIDKTITVTNFENELFFGFE